jgi:phenylalanyl-tRNA synthetase beta chain
VLFEVNITKLLLERKKDKVFKPLPKYPPVKEDITLTIEKKPKLGEVLSEIEKVKNVSLATFESQHGANYTFHIEYTDPNKNLTTEDAKKIREDILKNLKEKFGATIKD